ncbi:NAD(P)/FAD-dependent oxidoreductase [Candidatus Saccharibacteria bacterium]|nr:NAD(P)/FAD-dependent oxidoreductase [Candidatus Saccharibacteria bacterium]
MGKKYNFDYVVIGSGPAGTTVALTLAKNKKTRVAMIEGDTYGGSNLNKRDIPYAISLGFAHAYAKLSAYPEINSRDMRYNFPTVVAHQERIVTALGGNSKKIYEEAGITCIDGFASFINKNTVVVGDSQITAKNFIIATGAKLKTNEIAGLDHVNYLTPETAIKVRRLPKFVFIIGGGSTGCEIAEYFAELGAKTLIMESEPRILPREDREASALITDYFTNKLGIMVIPNSKVVAVTSEGKTKTVIFTSGGQEKMVNVDCVVLATGSEPNTDLGLENAGVQYKPSGIVVDKFFHTSAKNIYAVGDCTGGDSSTERSEYEASVLAVNLTSRAKNQVNYGGFIRVTSTYPEIATVGLNEVDLNKRKRKFQKAVVPLKDVPASKTERLAHGFVKIITDMTGRVIGATIVAPNAALMAEEFSIAIRHHLTALEIASTPHITNSWNFAVKLAAKKLIEGPKDKKK